MVPELRVPDNYLTPFGRKNLSHIFLADSLRSHVSRKSETPISCLYCESLASEASPAKKCFGENFSPRYLSVPTLAADSDAKLVVAFLGSVVSSLSASASPTRSFLASSSAIDFIVSVSVSVPITVSISVPITVSFVVFLVVVGSVGHSAKLYKLRRQ